jgi:hypothetical protein
MKNEQRQDLVTVVSGDAVPPSWDTTSGSGVRREQEATVRKLKFVVRAGPERRGAALYDLNRRLVRRGSGLSQPPEFGPTSTSSETPAVDKSK